MVIDCVPYGTVPVNAVCWSVARSGGTKSRVPRVSYVKWLRGRTILRSRCRLRSQSRAVSVVFVHTLVCCAYQSNMVGRLQESTKPGFLHVS